MECFDIINTGIRKYFFGLSYYNKITQLPIKEQNNG